MLKKAQIPVQVDVGSGDAVTPQAVEKTLPTILDLPAPHLKIYPAETFAAEKFEAMVKLGLSNSRTKYFRDVDYLIKKFDFKGKLIQKAIRATFNNRQTAIPEGLPVALTEKFVNDALILPCWTAFIN